MDKPRDLDILMIKEFYSKNDSDRLFNALLKSEGISYEARDITLFGKTYKQLALSLGMATMVLITPTLKKPLNQSLGPEV